MERRRPRSGCFAALLMAAIIFVGACVWIWWGLECIPVQISGGEATFVECDPVPNTTKLVMSMVMAPLALLLGAVAGRVTVRLSSE